MQSNNANSANTLGDFAGFIRSSIACPNKQGQRRCPVSEPLWRVNYFFGASFFTSFFGSSFFSGCLAMINSHRIVFCLGQNLLGDQFILPPRDGP